MDRTSAHDALAEIQTAKVFRPGDRVLLTVDERWSRQQFDDYRADVLPHLREYFPGVEFAVMCGVSAIAVQRGEEEGGTGG